MRQELEQLKQIVASIHPLTENEWTSFSAIWKQTSVSRKQIITAAGQKENYLYFVLEGVQRVYYYDEMEREATLVFTYAPSFGGVVDSLLLQQPSKYFYETLTQSTLLQAPYSKLQELMMKSPGIETFIRKALTITLSGLLERIVELQCYTSEEKFKKLLQRSPHILQLIPHKYLANYIGIDATNFSKLINTVRI